MARRTPPHVNASLIREGRMIFQQLSGIFGTANSRPTNFNDVMVAEAAAKAAKKAQPSLYCAFCLHVRKTNPDPAMTVINGHAVCSDHSYYVQGEKFNRILEIIKGDVNRNTR
jgi:hypothetical protein